MEPLSLKADVGVSKEREIQCIFLEIQLELMWVWAKREKYNVFFMKYNESWCKELMQRARWVKSEFILALNAFQVSMLYWYNGKNNEIQCISQEILCISHEIQYISHVGVCTERDGWWVKSDFIPAMNAFQAAPHFIPAKVGRMACIAFLRPTTPFYHFEAHHPILSFRPPTFLSSTECSSNVPALAKVIKKKAKRA